MSLRRATPVANSHCEGRGEQYLSCARINLDTPSRRGREGGGKEQGGREDARAEQGRRRVGVSL